MAVLAGSRIRENNVRGTTTDNPLTNSATTVNSAGLANLPAVSGNHAVLVLDPLRAAGAPEIVIVTAHTASATSATITRGAYGTTARQHASGTLWVHAPTIDDVIRIVTSSTRPADQYKGQLIHETDTDYYMGHNGTAWEHGLKLGAWVAWTPVISGGTGWALGNGSVSGRYVKVGRTVHYVAAITFGSTSTYGTTIPSLSLPVAADLTVGGALYATSVRLFDASAVEVIGAVAVLTSTTVGPQALNAAGTYVVRNNVTSTVPFTWTTSDRIEYHGTYEAAS